MNAVTGTGLSLKSPKSKKGSGSKEGQLLTIEVGLSQHIALLKEWSKLSKLDKDECCKSIIDTAQTRRLSVDEICQLALGLASSGKIFKWDFQYSPTLDICSTGGPASLSTILSPLMAATQEIFLPQLSVPGEIAGAIDTLGIIPNYKYNQTHDSIKVALSESKIAFALNSKDLAPADLYLFNLRKAKSARDIPDLVIASLLSKKISTGINNSVVDVRIGPHGNFGKSYGEAKENSEKLISVYKSLGMTCKCVLTNSFGSPMPYYGRAESLTALFKIINGNVDDEWLLQHLNTCVEIAAVAVASVKRLSLDDTRFELLRSLNEGKVRDVFLRNLNAQGSSLKEMEMIINDSKITNKMIVRTQVDGYFKGLDYRCLRTLMKENDPCFRNESKFKTLVGLKPLIREGTQTRKGDDMLEIRGTPEILSNYIDIIEKIGMITTNDPKYSQEPIYEVI
jgi:pyrimidine-nucleoside phosphorylase